MVHVYLHIKCSFSHQNRVTKIVHDSHKLQANYVFGINVSLHLLAHITNVWDVQIQAAVKHEPSKD
jgi:hypothetical protein